MVYIPTVMEWRHPWEIQWVVAKILMVLLLKCAFYQEFTLTISPSHRWGSCFFAADSGTISPVSYTQTIYPDQGLWLEVYREGHAEEYVINYIIVEIYEN